ncbi:scopoletin glucosyltransferase isoform X2 [Ricinus communis]|uniref:scopoletin glucosyltransferase isoform X1 n=1 Tax=Ricinus communis TaxID=3988 RepID=UPI00201B2B5B|nr:scopoletin glucosyltransferase isoform X1 [Ricinus communis]XP_048231845.1 scopoletin glucosyltransferase isoform X2 [Ricinus communis]
MDSQPYQLHIAFFPYMAHGHMIPTMDMARLFARHGVKATIITTPFNASLISKTIERDRQKGFEIGIQLINFASAETGLPEGCENARSIRTQEMAAKFFKAISLLQQPLEHVLKECHPNCLVADMMFPWATEVASKFGIPRLVFHGISTFSLCVYNSLRHYEPHKGLASDFEPFMVPGLPDQIKITRLQVPDYIKEKNKQTELTHRMSQSELTSYGVLLNSFYELEPAYLEHYRKVMGRKAWSIGPLSLCNNDREDKMQRGDTASISGHECLRWLDSKKPNSVLYICFGSMFKFSTPQLIELAMALESSGQNFIWVVKKKENGSTQEEWLPEGLEKRMEGKGLIIRGWAPQVLILDHEAIGGFMTHCGWNSTLEGVAAGVPMVTWPLFAEQFFNEKLVTGVLKVGVGVGAQEWSRFEKKILIKKEDIEKAVTRLMIGEEAQELRNKAKALKEMTRKVHGEGGSSQSDMIALLEELKTVKITMQN